MCAHPRPSLLSLLFFLLPHALVPGARTATGGEVAGAGRLRGGEERAEVGSEPPG